MSLATRHCVSCRGGLPLLDAVARDAGLEELRGWALAGEATRLERSFTFRDFAGAMRFVNAMAALARMGVTLTPILASAVTTPTAVMTKTPTEVTSPATAVVRAWARHR